MRPRIGKRTARFRPTSLSGALSTVVDVLYIHPAKQAVGFRYDLQTPSPPYLFMPVGVIGLANLLRGQGLKVKGLNLPLELILAPTFNLRAWLKQHRPRKLVMIDLHWYEHSFGALDVARVCKEMYPEVPVVLGGITASVFSREILARFPQVDYIIRGDAEDPLRRLAAGDGLASIPNLVYREGESVIEADLVYCAAPEELDRLDFVDTDFLEHRDSYSSMQYSGARVIRDASRRGHWLCIGRGCVFDCSFCGGGKAAQARFAGRQGLVLRSVDRVIEDIDRLQAHGVHQVSFSLDPAIFGSDYWSSLFEGLQLRNLEIGLYNEFFQLPSDEFLQAFTETADLSHSEVGITLLSGDEGVRRRNGKFYSNRRLFQVLSWLRRHQVPIFIYFSTNLPTETEKTFRRTLQLAQRIADFYPEELLRMHNMCHTVDPLSPMALDPDESGIQVNMRTFDDYYRYCERTARGRPDIPRGEWRGFSDSRRRQDEVETIARRWDSFCAGQRFACYTCPTSW